MIGIVGALVAVSTVGGALMAGGRAEAAVARMTIGSGLASCPAGYVCLWSGPNYTGTGYAFFNDETSYANLPSPYNGIEQNAESFYSHGNYSDIRFYRNNSFTGDSFILCKGEKIPSLPPNTDIDPPAYEPGEGWVNRISAHDFGSFCS